MASDLTEPLARLRDDLRAVRLELDVPGAEEARHARDDLIAQVDDYLLPRLRQMDAPALIVVGGSTGAGKSTLVNSLVGSVVSPAGVLRPTTRAPVLACHPDDVRWFEGDRVLPGLPRVTGGPGGAGTLQLVPTAALPEGLALLDSPDIDSVLAENRALAEPAACRRRRLALRHHRRPLRRRRAVGVPALGPRAGHGPLGRAQPGARGRRPRGARAPAADAVASERLGDADVLVVPEVALEDELLPADALWPVRAWLDGLAADAQARAALVRRTLRGALASLPVRAALVERAAVDQLSAAAELRAEADAAYAEALREVEAALRSGSLLRGEVLARWHEVVGTGDVMRALETRVGWLRDRLKSIVTGAPAADAELKVTVEHRVEAVVRTAAERAAERTARAWRERVPGRALLEGSSELERASTGLDAAAEEQVRAWQGVVFDLVREEGASKRATARLASLGVNGAGLTVMLAVFAQTGGLTGAEIIVAGGTSAVGQKVLEAIFGDQAVRTLASRAREDLIERIDRLLRAEAKRFDELLDASAPEADSFARLHTAVDAIRRAA